MRRNRPPLPPATREPVSCPGCGLEGIVLNRMSPSNFGQHRVVRTNGASLSFYVCAGCILGRVDARVRDIEPKPTIVCAGVLEWRPTSQEQETQILNDLAAAYGP